MKSNLDTFTETIRCNACSAHGTDDTFYYYYYYGYYYDDGGVCTLVNGICDAGTCRGCPLVTSECDSGTWDLSTGQCTTPPPDGTSYDSEEITR